MGEIIVLVDGEIERAVGLAGRVRVARRVLEPVLLTDELSEVERDALGLLLDVTEEEEGRA
jgi:hypothetical protein